MLQDYVVERLPPRMFVPLAALIALAGRIDVVPTSASGLLADGTVVLLLLAQFRLWDDLADRRRDAVEHPQRVLVRAPSDTMFRVACLILSAVNAATLAIVYESSLALVTFVTLTSGMALWYTTRGPRSLAADHVLLLKYPAFVLIVAAGRHVAHPGLVACSAAAIYLAACVYEAVHDPASPAAGNRILMACEAFALAGLGFFFIGEFL